MKKIAVVAGGNSAEFDISVKSGRMVMKSIDAKEFEPYFVLVKGTDWTAEVNGQIYPVDKDDFSVTISGEKIRFDAAYLIIHGSPGEDGRIQGYFDIMNIPYVGPGIVCCSLTSSKSLSKDLIRLNGLPTAKSKLLPRGTQPDWDKLVKELSLPLFIKPNSGGSSVATHKVKTIGGLQAAFEDACLYDHEVLAEEFLQGTEITCGIYDNDGSLVCLPITEIRPHNEFFDYKAKYMGESDEITPAPLPDELRLRINELTQKVYRVLHCDSMVRVDFIIRDGVPYFMEVNTIPGFSEASIVPQQLRAAGLDVTEVVTSMIRNKVKG
jgi:D-alanine-D-alanine ligase